MRVESTAPPAGPRAAAGPVEAIGAAGQAGWPTEPVELVAARAAAQPRNGHALAPPVVGVRGSRPVLARVHGRRLDELINTAPPSAVAARGLAATGRLVAAVHLRPAPLDRPVPTAAMPWTALRLEAWLGLSDAQRTVCAEFAARPGVARCAEAIVDRLGTGGVWLHGDARPDNIYLPDSDHPLLVDWEMTGLGCSEYDVATMCAGLLTLVLTREIATNVSTAAARTELRSALDRARMLIGHFRAGYAGGQADPLDSTLLGAAVGLLLIGNGWSRCLHLTLDRRTRALLDLGVALLTEPARWRLLDDHAR